MLDVKVHQEPIIRGAGQIIPMARRLFYACELTGAPALQEPVFLVEIQTSDDCVGTIYTTISRRRGVVNEEQPVAGTPLVNMKCFLPVGESFGFTQDLRAATGGRAFPQCVFDHWEQFNDDPLTAGTKANLIVEDIRKRKGLKPGIPELGNFLDKL